MKHLLALAALTGCLTATCAWAQDWRFDIPFAFHVGEARLSAGTYTVHTYQQSMNLVKFVSRISAKEQAAAMVFYDKGGFPKAAKLVFTRYGNQEYFLSEIWDPGYSRAAKAVKSKQELVTSKLVARLVPEKIEVRATASGQ